jgi:glycosyltransferase involved in cell wall biosynthesis
MKFLFVIFGELSSESSGGRANFNFNLLQEFKKDNNIIGVMCISSDSKSINEFRNVYTLTSVFFYKIIFKYGYLIRRIFKKWNFRKFQEKLFDEYFKKKIKPRDYDLVIVTKPVVPAVTEKVKAEGVKLYSFATIAHPEFNRNIMLELEKKYDIKINSNYKDEERSKRVSSVYKMSDKVILTVNSPFLIKTYQDNGITGQKLIGFNNDVTINTGFFLPIKNESTKPLTFLTLGYMNLIKGITALLEAWKEFKEKSKNDARLLIAGPVSNDLKPVLKNYNPKELNIEYAGKVERKDIVNTYNSADVFIASSFSDLGPETIPEAMACGLPVIGSLNCGNSKYIENGRNGFVYDAFNPEELKSHLIWFAENKEKIKSMGENARLKVESVKNSDFNDEFYKYCISN